MSAFHRLQKPVATEQFLIDRDVSGGVRLRLGPASFVISPQKAVQVATAILRCAGVGVELANPGQAIIRPAGRLAS